MNPSVYVKIDGKEVGPIEWTQLVNDVKTGSLDPDLPMRFVDSVIWTSYKSFTDKQRAEAETKKLMRYLTASVLIALVIIGILKPQFAGMLGILLILLSSIAIYVKSWTANKESIGSSAIAMSLGSMPMVSAPAPRLAKGLLLTGILLCAYTLIRAYYA